MKKYFAIFVISVAMVTAVFPACAQVMVKPDIMYFEYGWGWGNFTPPSGNSDSIMMYPKSIFFPDLTLMNERGEKAYLSDYKNSFVLLNIWATWCAPCVAEMPSLNRLQKELGSNLFNVVALSVEQDKEIEIRKFFTEHKIDNLDVWVDKRGSVEQINGMSGLPITFLLDPFRKELARFVGPVDWDSPEIRSLISYYLHLWQEKTPERVRACEKEKEGVFINPYTGDCL